MHNNVLSVLSMECSPYFGLEVMYKLGEGGGGEYISLGDYRIGILLLRGWSLLASTVFLICIELQDVLACYHSV